MHVRPGILDAQRNVVNDEPEVMWIWSESNVIKRAVGVVSRDKDRTAVKIPSIFSRVAESVDGPGSIVRIGTEVVDARFTCWNRRLRRELRRRLGEINGRAAGEHPRLGILRKLQVHVRAGVLNVAVVNDEAQQSIELCWIDSHIVVSAVSVVPCHEVIGSAKVAVRIGSREEGKEVPVRVVIVRAMVMDACLAGRNRWVGLLDGGRLRAVQHVAAGELPELVALRCGIDEFVRPRVFRVALVNDDADVLGRRSDAHVEERAETVASGHLHGAAVEVGRVFGGVAEGIDSPAQIVAVRTEVMNADVVRGNGGRGLGFKQSRRCAQQEENKNKNGRKGGCGTAMHDSHSRFGWAICFFRDPAK